MGISLPHVPRFTAIWQSEKFYERYWLKDLFQPYISDNIVDGKHEVVADNVILFDSVIYSHDPAYYAKFRGKNAFLVHVGDEFFELGTDRYVHFKGVFRTMWSSVFNFDHVMVIPLGYSLENEEPKVAASDRRYAWSFIGEAGKSSRPDMVRALASIEPHITYSVTPVRGVTFFDLNTLGQRRIPRPEFSHILAQSAFAPAPMGNASLESCRLYDALKVGAIPIIERRLTLDYFRKFFGDHPLPTVRSWGEAHKFIVKMLDQPAEMDILQQRCLSWWEQYRSSLGANIGEFLSRRSNASDSVVPLRSNVARSRFWKYFELARHQDLPSFGRRIERQVLRVFKSRKWRVAHHAGSRIGPS
jgi:hypothetical protein